MAQRRMFSLQIVDTDAFLEMPTSSQLLYFHLSMRADDDGFVANPKKIMKMVGAGEDDLKVLLTKRFILGFESGVIVIKHWRMNNYIQSDRYKETAYLEEKNLIEIKDNGSYTECIQDVYKLDTQVRLGKDSLDKVSVKTSRFTPPTLEEQIKPFINSYPPSMITDFTLYWDETDSKGTPRWKKEKTWNIDKRLLKWKRNQEKWDYAKSQKFVKVEEKPERKPEERTNSGFSKITFN